MIRLISIALSLCAMMLLSAAPAVANSKQPLRIYAWVNYMPQWLLEEFTQETGIPVTISFFAENKVLYHKLKDESAFVQYDIITPSAEMVQRLAFEQLLLPLEHTKLPNIAGIDPWFAKLPHDKGGQYSVPLFWGVLMLVIDKSVVPEDVAAKIQSYQDLWMPELSGKIILPNDFRSIMSAMLLTLHYPINDKNMTHLTEALQKFQTLAPHVLLYDTVDIEDSLARTSTGVALTWGNAHFFDDEHDKYQTVLPKEGFPMWIDTLAIPASAKNSDAAHVFINFILEPERLARLSVESGYAVAGTDAQAFIPSALRNNSVVYLPTHLRYKLTSEAMFPPEAEALERAWEVLRDMKE